MTPELTRSALEQCHLMVYQRDNHSALSAVLQAIDFADVYFKYRYFDPCYPLPLELRLGIPPVRANDRAEKFPLDKYKPGPDGVRKHVVWMLEDLDGVEATGHDERLKHCRWYGFAEKDSISHYVAHLALGFLQGWLWAGGHASVDDFRVMNKPDAKRTAAA
jgi:hypothetical protein